MINLTNIKLRIEYAVISTGQPFEEAKEFDLATIKMAPAQPDASTRSKIVLALEKVPGTNRYILNRKRPDLQFNFDTDHGISMLNGSLKLIIQTQEDTGSQFIDTALYPILQENDNTFTNSAELAGVVLHTYVLQEDIMGVEQSTIVYVSANGGGIHSDCSGCHESPSRDKRVSCALDGCYSAAA